jgi:hypothetical protein
LARGWLFREASKYSGSCLARPNISPNLFFVAPAIEVAHSQGNPTPAKMVEARKGGASREDLHRRPFAAEFLPAEPFGPRLLLD